MWRSRERRWPERKAGRHIVETTKGSPSERSRDLRKLALISSNGILRADVAAVCLQVDLRRGDARSIPSDCDIGSHSHAAKIGRRSVAAIRASMIIVSNHHRQSLASAGGLHLSCGGKPQWKAPAAPQLRSGPSKFRDESPRAACLQWSGQ
jgi:hypothetical protein